MQIHSFSKTLRNSKNFKMKIEKYSLKTETNASRSAIKMGFGKFAVIVHIKFSGKDFPANYTGNDLKILTNKSDKIRNTNSCQSVWNLHCFIPILFYSLIHFNWFSNNQISELQKKYFNIHFNVPKKYFNIHFNVFGKKQKWMETNKAKRFFKDVWTTF